MRAWGLVLAFFLLVCPSKRVPSPGDLVGRIGAWYMVVWFIFLASAPETGAGGVVQLLPAAAARQLWRWHHRCTAARRVTQWAAPTTGACRRVSARRASSPTGHSSVVYP